MSLPSPYMYICSKSAPRVYFLKNIPNDIIDFKTCAVAWYTDEFDMLTLASNLAQLLKLHV